MPLELWLDRGDGWDAAALEAFLAERPHWRADEGYATHDHPDSGVELSLIWAPPGGVDAAPWGGGSRLMLRLNLLRPRYFALAAANEIEALIAVFGAAVEGLEPWMREAFLERFEEANRAAFAAVDTRGDEWLGYDSQKLEEIWRWNDRRAWLQELVPELFVPRISFTRSGERARSTVVWTDLVAIALPVVERVVVLRTWGDAPGLVELPNDRLEAICPPAARVPHVALPHRVMGQPPPELRALADRLPPVEIEGLPATAVVDADLLA